MIWPGFPCQRNCSDGGTPAGMTAQTDRDSPVKTGESLSAPLRGGPFCVDKTEQKEKDTPVSEETGVNYWSWISDLNR